MYLLAKIIIKILIPALLVLMGLILYPAGLFLWFPAYGFARIKM